MDMDEVERNMDSPDPNTLKPGAVITTNTGNLWIHRSEAMRCATCMWYVAKLSKAPSLDPITGIGRCRRHAPTMSGYPVVFPIDWCGDHKPNENCD